MKKLFFIILSSMLLIALSNCKDDVPGSSGTFNPNDTIPKATAIAMYNHYMDSAVDKTDSAIIRQIFPSVASMAQVLKTKNLVGIKFLVAAFLDSDPIVSRRNRPMIMLQLKTEKGGVIEYKYYDLSSVSKEAAPKPPYCPPPPACALEPVEG